VLVQRREGAEAGVAQVAFVRGAVPRALARHVGDIAGADREEARGLVMMFLMSYWRT
jgi:hypothetical protein